MDLPDSMETMHKLAHIAEAQKIQRRHHDEKSSDESKGEGIVVLLSAGAVIMVLKQMCFSTQSWLELAWTVPLAAAVVWLPTAGLVFLLDRGNDWKNALWMGAVPSFAALITLAFPIILLLVLIVFFLCLLLNLIGGAFRVYRWLSCGD